ncbi:hypothetical protein JKP88DRAFT_263664 [Tribonema minus]|uniref:Uncharacterized protein n=1 Tax=Tribonema minus TaxID=303371 RepID=A0A836CDI8_9STRA|nr:hypothetical protein JKP88DRAFT_263664 [Tribonema minus]
MCRQQSSETWTLSLGSARPLAEAVAAPAAALNAGLRIPAASDGDQMESQEHAVDFHSAQAAAEGDRDSRASPVQQRGRWRLGRRRRRGAAAEAAEAAEGALTALPVHATGTSAPAAAAAPWELEAAAYRNVLPASAVNDADTAVQRQQREHSLQWRRRQQRRQAAAAAAADATPPFEAYGDAQLRGDGGSGGDSGGGGGDGFDSSSSGGEDGGSGGDASDAIAQLHALPLFESWRDDDAAAMSDSSALPRSSSASSFDALLNSGSDDDLLEELSSGGGSRRGSGAATPGLEVEEGGCDAPQQEVAIEDDYDAEIDESILAVLAAELSDDTLAEMADAAYDSSGMAPPPPPALSAANTWPICGPPTTHTSSLTAKAPPHRRRRYHSQTATLRRVTCMIRLRKWRASGRSAAGGFPLTTARTAAAQLAIFAIVHIEMRPAWRIPGRRGSTRVDQVLYATHSRRRLLKLGER